MVIPANTTANCLTTTAWIASRWSSGDGCARASCWLDRQCVLGSDVVVSLRKQLLVYLIFINLDVLYKLVGLGILFLIVNLDLVILLGRLALLLVFA